MTFLDRALVRRGELADRHLDVPWDEMAERCVVGCAIATASGAAAQAVLVRADDFYSASYRRLYNAALSLDAIETALPVCCTAAVRGGTWCANHPYVASLTTVRVAAVAMIADAYILEVAELVDERPMMWGTAGTYAARVVEGARRRAMMAAAAEIFNGLGRGYGPDAMASAISLLAGAA